MQETVAEWRSEVKKGSRLMDVHYSLTHSLIHSLVAVFMSGATISKVLKLGEGEGGDHGVEVIVRVSGAVSGAVTVSCYRPDCSRHARASVSHPITHSLTHALTHALAISQSHSMCVCVCDMVGTH
jgi:hypothetical protein